jgi:hypothetical protein
MARLAVYGSAHGLDGRDAAMKATQKALDQLGALKPVLTVAFVAEEFNISEALSGLASLLGDTPLWGFSTVRAFCEDHEEPNSVVVLVLAGSDLKAQVQWYSNYSQESGETARQLLRSLRQELLLPQAVLVAADGVMGNFAPVKSVLSELQTSVGGAMASGGFSSGKTYLMGKNQSGPGGLAAAVLGGRFRLACGYSHGWRSTGAYFTVTQAKDTWVKELDGQSPAEVYQKLFGRPAREWAFPPLTDLVRLYPLGVEGSQGNPDVLVRSPLRMEIDGSMRMNVAIPEGAVVHLMIGDPAECLKAIERAAQMALEGLGSARPLAALAFVDIAWLNLFETHTQDIPQAIQEALGSIPVLGAYTLGQLVRSNQNAQPELLNQGIGIVLLGAAE